MTIYDESGDDDEARMARSNDPSLGPVTLLAHEAAAKSEAAKAALRAKRLESLSQEQAAVAATAALVGETALALLTTSNHAGLSKSSSFGSSSGGASPRKPSKPQDGGAPAEQAVSLRRPAARAGARGLPWKVQDDAGIQRGRFSQTQVQQLVDAWARDSDDGSDEDEDYWNSPLSSSGGFGSAATLNSLGSSAHSPRSSWRVVSPQRRDDWEHKELESDCEAEMYGYCIHSPLDKRLSPADTGAGGIGGNLNGDAKSKQINANFNNNDASRAAGGGGLFQTAKNWLQSQRQKLARMELERQVEDQRRKLVEEARKQRALEAERRRRAGLVGDDKMVIRLQHQANNENGYHSHFVSSGICGLGSVSLDDSTEYSGVIRVDSSGHVVGIVSGGSFSDNDDDFLKVSSPQKTVSGFGISVNVDLPTETTAIPESNEDIYIKNIKIVSEPSKDESCFTPPIISPVQIQSLVASEALPPSISYCKWKRLYSLARDGDSFETFLRLVEGNDRTVLVVQTSRGQLFGGYADTRWGANRRPDEFYGSGQACLFRFPSGVNREECLSSLEEEGNVIVYKWSGVNRYIQLCDSVRRTLAFGGGGDGGVFGLCIEDDFKRGTTGRCATFENDPLCDEGYFDIMDLEVWGFTLDF